MASPKAHTAFLSSVPTHARTHASRHRFSNPPAPRARQTQPPAPSRVGQLVAKKRRRNAVQPPGSRTHRRGHRRAVDTARCRRRRRSAASASAASSGAATSTGTASAAGAAAATGAAASHHFRRHGGCWLRYWLRRQIGRRLGLGHRYHRAADAVAGVPIRAPRTAVPSTYRHCLRSADTLFPYLDGAKKGQLK